MKLNIKVRILPFGDIDKETLHILKVHLNTLFTPLELLKPIPLLHSAYDPNRQQYLSDDFLDKVRRYSISVSGIVLGVTDVDLYTHGLNFVFGQAKLPGTAAVISLARLNHKNPEIYKSRMIKEAVHELGHTLGLRHCPNEFCVMHFSNSLMDTDIKKPTYCQVCEKKMRKLSLIKK